LIAERAKPRTVFFGGGTPSLLNLAQWKEVLSGMERLGLLGAEEWTVECNPATVSLDKARLLRDHGVNRISMGVQSLDEGLLERLGRIHSREMVFKSYDILRSAGFENINLDLMFAIPGQTMEVWRKTLDEIISMQPEHLSSYEVIYEEDTPLYAQLKAGQFDVDEELACAMYEELIDLAALRGYTQYEIANFGSGAVSEFVPARACQHNLVYWRGGSYFGVGPSASEHVDGRRTRNWANTILYCEQLEKGLRAIDFKEELTPFQRAGETALFGLRMNAGWRFDEFVSVTGCDLRKHWRPVMDTLVARGWAIEDAERFRLSRQGLRFADAAGEEFLVLDDEAQSLSRHP